jgi:hypothetical protein
MINDGYFFLTFCAFFPLFISNTSIVSINFGANLDAQNAGNGGPKFSPRPPIHAWYIGHTRGLLPLLSHSNILSHRKVPFQKMPPHGKILKKGPARCLGYTRLVTIYELKVYGVDYTYCQNGGQRVLIKNRGHNFG